MKKTTVTTLLILGGICSASAQGIGIRGVSNCGEWLANQKNANQQMVLRDQTNVIGMLTGMNVMYQSLGNSASLDFFKGTHSPSNEQIFAWMDKFCRDNPLKDTAIGSLYLFSEIVEKSSTANLK